MTPTQRPGQNPRPGLAALVFAIAGIIVLGAVSLWFAITAPDVVPSHFDVAGRPDAWSSKASVLAVLVPLGLGISIVFAIRGIWTRIPKAFINAPHKEYWFARGDERFFYDCLMEFLRINAGGLALLFSTILISTAAARPAQSGSEPQVPLVIPTIGYLVVAAASVWLLFRRLQPRD